jgi:vacuolar-type H+-ATPase subunit I/STV1
MLQGLIVIALGFVLNILETWFFGWNMKAASIPEAFADFFCQLVVFIGLLMFAIGYYVHIKN